MTLVSTIISDAFRQSNLLALGVSPTTAQSDEALRYLNRIVKGVFGKEAGENFTSMPVGRANISRPSGYPWYNDVPDSDWFVPENVRLVFNLENSLDIYLSPRPDDGARFAVIDPAGNLATYPVTVYGNGRLIEDVESIVLNTDGYSGEWFYRADLSTWKLYSPLLTSDTFPFPEEFDDFFITLLAVRLNPSYGASLDEQSDMMMKRAQNILRARYTQHEEVPVELGLLRMPKTAIDRDRWGGVYDFYNPNDMFNKGYPW